VVNMVECAGTAMAWKNVILDFDGTLVDSQSSSGKDVLKKLNKPSR